MVELEGRARPGFGDAHIPLDELTLLRVGLDVHWTRSRQEVIDKVRAAAKSRPSDQWIVGRGWNYSAWSEPNGRPDTT